MVVKEGRSPFFLQPITPIYLVLKLQTSYHSHICRAKRIEVLYLELLKPKNRKTEEIKITLRYMRKATIEVSQAAWNS